MKEAAEVGPVRDAGSCMPRRIPPARGGRHLFTEDARDRSMRRCDWATNDLAIRYHDQEWGVPVHDDRRWFEFLVLGGAQAGLSWDTILKKRERYRDVFDGFDPAVVAQCHVAASLVMG
jgi:hypothetical protein